ncbi:hypothetical protein K1T71_002897 [Dendrolimus kikuchii]|uniref:Uncharacterized protein n=1 Tax=Dendrolimus kikuchii TaxID=765133 RepID=A0ACC1DE81_9NEOP|nr:hypothetical protein K1T71_002897 [Dendrolimus kikuchii]
MKPKTKPNKENSLSLTDLTDPTLLTEIRLLRQEISDMKAQNVEISLLRQELLELKHQITAMSSTALENQTKVREELETAQKSIIDLKCTVTQLQQRLNFQEQNELRNEIEIIGIPELNNENLAHVIQVTSQKIGIQLAETDIDYMSRIGPKRSQETHSLTTRQHQPRPIIVKLLRRQKRNEIISAAKARKNLTSESIVPGSPKKIYINERLTKDHRVLFREARDQAAANKFKYCWIKNGGIFVRENDNKPAIKINSINDLNKYVVS